MNMSLSPELYSLIVKIVKDEVKDIKVRREEFDKLSNEVTKIAENLDRLATRVNELAEAQKKTEEAVAKLTERVDKLTERVNELAEAQKKTEEAVAKLTERVDKLTERVDKLTERVNELAEAQKKTEEAVAKLAIQMNNLSLSVGRLSDVIGFGLEDIARVVVPGWLERHEKIYVKGLVRKFFEVDGEIVEVNLYGEGMRRQRNIYILGEIKSRIYGRDVREFLLKLNKISRLFEGKEVYKFMFGFLIHPSAEKEANKHGIKTIASYMR